MLYFQFKIYELFFSIIFYLIFSDYSWPRVTENAEHTTVYKGERLYIHNTGTVCAHMCVCMCIYNILSQTESFEYLSIWQINANWTKWIIEEMAMCLGSTFSGLCLNLTLVSQMARSCPELLFLSLIDLLSQIYSYSHVKHDLFTLILWIFPVSFNFQLTASRSGWAKGWGGTLRKQSLVTLPEVLLGRGVVWKNTRVVSMSNSHLPLGGASHPSQLFFLALDF